LTCAAESGVHPRIRIPMAGGCIGVGGADARGRLAVFSLASAPCG
jgi:hypothetical protein